MYPISEKMAIRKVIISGWLKSITAVLILGLMVQPAILFAQPGASEVSEADISIVRLQKAIDLYYSGNFEDASVILNLLIESGKLSQNDQLRAYQFLGASFILQHNLNNARNEIIHALQLDPQLMLDPAVWNPEVVNFFNLVKSEVLGALRVESVPDSSMLILNGAPVGYTPVVLNNLVSQEYEIRFEIQGYYSYVDTVLIRPNTERLESVTLTPKPKLWRWISGGVALAVGALILMLNAFKSSSDDELKPLGDPPPHPR